MSRPAFVLVHGAYHGGWCWRFVADLLRGEGHRVFTPSQTGLGDRAHLMGREITMDTFVSDVVQVLESEELTDVVLVGHSFGGRTVTGVADRVPSALRQLVYLDAGIPVGGASRLEQMPPDSRAERLRQAEEHDGGVSVPPPSAARFGLTDPEHIAWVDRRLSPQPLSVEASRLELAHEIGNGVPTSYVRFHDANFGGLMLGSDEFARSRTDWDYLEVEGSHDAMVSAPGLVTELLLASASAGVR